MAQLLSNAHINLIINGHRFSGFADEDRPVEFPGGEDFFTLSTGPDGALYGMAIPMFGGPITVRLEPSSPSVQWAVQQNNMRKNALKSGDPFTIYDGSYSDPAQGRSARVAGGVFMQCPEMPEANVTFEIQFHFEEIFSNVDGGTFVPSPVAEVAGQAI